MADTANIVMPMEQEGTKSVVRAWLKKIGDAVKRDEPIVELETDKVAVEVPSPADGVLTTISLNEGDEAAPGATLGVLQLGATADRRLPAGIVLPPAVVGACAGAALPAGSRRSAVAPSCKTPSVAPGAASSPSFSDIVVSTPSAGAGTSTATLSVSSSTIGSSRFTASPIFFSQARTTDFVPSCSIGMTMFAVSAIRSAPALQS